MQTILSSYKPSWITQAAAEEIHTHCAPNTLFLRPLHHTSDAQAQQGLPCRQTSSTHSVIDVNPSLPRQECFIVFIAMLLTFGLGTYVHRLPSENTLSKGRKHNFLLLVVLHLH